MAKQGFTRSNVPPVLVDRAAERGWCLCVGAGTSYPLFPSWTKLVEDLIAQDVREEPHDVAAELLERFSPDALIQAARDRLGMREEEFVSLIIEHLYRRSRERFSASEWKLYTKVLAAKHIGGLQRPTWIRFDRLVTAHLADLSAVQIAGVLADVLDSSVCPQAILSFNAEPLLFALINSEVVKRKWNNDAQSAPSDVLDRVTHSITTRRPTRVPYYFCHGMVPVPKPPLRTAATDKLVFSESAYLQLANASFSWQSTVFLDIAMSQSIVFVGVSLSDSNMRRWLSWVHSNRTREIEEYHGDGATSAIHYWVAKEPDSASEKRWIESAVAHLGVRLVWISEWSETGHVLRLMLGKETVA